MQHLDPGRVGDRDQPGDTVQRAGRPGLLGQFGQRAPRAHDPLLAFDRQEHCGGRIELLGELILRWHGCPSLRRTGRVPAADRAREGSRHCVMREEAP
ncbi:hypothetical protein GCM10010433_09770 [Streptomyces pulveraceus]